MLLWDSQFINKKMKGDALFKTKILWLISFLTVQLVLTGAISDNAYPKGDPTASFPITNGNEKCNRSHPGSSRYPVIATDRAIKSFYTRNLFVY